MAPWLTRAVGGLAAVAALAGPAAGQEAAPIPSRQRTFRIPFEIERPDRRILRVHLYLSKNFGRTWARTLSAPPEQRSFSFQADEDGLYWFTTQTVDETGLSTPPVVQNVRPEDVLRVLVDTAPPVVYLRALEPRGGRVGVEWDARDDYLDLASLRLEYRMPGTMQWSRLPADAAASGTHYWTPATNGSVEVRLSVADRVGNREKAETTVALNGAGGRAPPDTYPPERAPREDSRSPRHDDVPVKWVKSKRITLQYGLREVGPSGVSSVDLWYTQDGRTWQKFSNWKKQDDKDDSVSFDVTNEGRYGLRLLVYSGVELSDRPPQPGDPPEIWIEVDTTRPVVQNLNVRVGRGDDRGKVFIDWKAGDKNLAGQPVSISYSRDTDGPWTKVISNLDNTGRYVWELPRDGIPHQFYLRVEAADLAGNVGLAQTPDLVKVDLSLPKGVILGIQPTGDGSASRDRDDFNTMHRTER